MKLLSEKEVDAVLEKVSERRSLLETALASVIKGYCPAAFVWGAPGLGKSYMIRAILDGMISGQYRHHTAYSTHKGLVLSLAECPDLLHLFEDCESLLRSVSTADTLRAACGAPNAAPRWVTYETANERIKFKMTGGIVVVTNANLARSNSPMQGVASRFRPIHWELTVPEVLATIQSIARGPFTHHGVTIPAKDVLLVARTLIDMVGDEDLSIPIDVRLFTEHALPTFAYCIQAKLDNWADVLRSKLVGKASTAAEGQEQRTRRLQALALSIAQDGTIKPKDRIARWKSLTGLGQAIYYRHLKSARA